MNQIIVKKCQKNFYKALYIVLIEIFLDKIKKPRNRKPRNGKPRKTRDYCILIWIMPEHETMLCLLMLMFKHLTMYSREGGLKGRKPTHFCANVWNLFNLRDSWNRDFLLFRKVNILNYLCSCSCSLFNAIMLLLAQLLTAYCLLLLV